MSTKAHVYKHVEVDILFPKTTFFCNLQSALMASCTPQNKSNTDIEMYELACINAMLLEPMDIDSEKVVKLAELLSLQPLEVQTVHGVPDVKHLGWGL